MPDFEQIIKNIKAVLQLTFGGSVPSWIWTLVGWVLLISLLLCAIWGLLVLISRIKDQWTQNFLPLFYNREQKQRSLHRKYFAGHILSEIERLGRQEEWKDYRYAELEAEIEAEGRRSIFSIVPFFKRINSGLRREKSLSKALASSQERLILVEGEPGSGKSIALRHVAERMAAHAKIARSTKSIIPIYVNLKELERQNGEPIDRNLIKTFILKSLKRINDRDIDKFLDDEFDLAIQNGTWVFLFDSFDELPEVLSSTEADAMIKSYGDAIHDFLHGMNQCRGVVASRQFRGPTYFGWPRFRILSLTEKRRLELIQKAGLKADIENELIGKLAIASQEIRLMASNPMLLNLLCEHMKNGYHFPENTYTIFETYIKERFERDEDRVKHRFGLQTTQLRAVAENIAFCMAAEPRLGLSPTRAALQSAIARFNMEIDSNFDILLDALEYIKFARSDIAADGVQSRSFTFAHRRFQEYFATCVVLREPSRVTSRQLLTDMRWRETAVVMCQTQPINMLAPLLEEGHQLLLYFCSQVQGLIDNPIEYLLRLSEDKIRGVIQQPILDGYLWPSGAFHLLGLLQDGFSKRLMDLPEDIRMSAGKFVLTATEAGTLSDKKWALEVAGVVQESVLGYLLTEAFLGKSQWLREVAYRQVASLSTISPYIAQGIRDAIIELASDGRLPREQHATKAHLARVNQSKDFLSTMQLLLWLPRIDIGLHVILFIVILPELIRVGFTWLFLALLFCLALYVSHKALWIFLGRLRSPISLYREYTLFMVSLTLSVLRSFAFLRHFASSYSDRPLRPAMLSISEILSFMLWTQAAFIARSSVFLVLFAWASSVQIGVPITIVVYSSLINRLPVILLVATYVVCFGPFAIWAARVGRFIHWRWWALLPIWPMIYLLTIPRSIGMFIQNFRAVSFIRTILLLSIGFVGLPALVYGAIIFWTGFIAQHYPLLYKIGNNILFVVLGIITMLSIGSIILIIYIWVKEWLRFNK